MFPAMVTAPVFSKHGASRNVNMDYGMLKSVVNQTVDLVTFVFVSVLGVCDGELRAELADTLKATADLVACAAARRQATAADHLLALRGHALTVFTALKSALAVDENAPDELRNFIPQAAVVRRAIDSAMRLLLVKLADDRDLEDDTGKECNALLQLVDRLRAILRLERLDDSDHARNFVAPARWRLFQAAPPLNTSSSLCPRPILPRSLRARRQGTFCASSSNLSRIPS